MIPHYIFCQDARIRSNQVPSLNPFLKSYYCIIEMPAPAYKVNWGNRGSKPWSGFAGPPTPSHGLKRQKPTSTPEITPLPHPFHSIPSNTFSLQLHNLLCLHFSYLSSANRDSISGSRPSHCAKWNFKWYQASCLQEREQMKPIHR